MSSFAPGRSPGTRLEREIGNGTAGSSVHLSMGVRYNVCVRGQDTCMESSLYGQLSISVKACLVPINRCATKPTFLTAKIVTTCNF